MARTYFSRRELRDIERAAKRLRKLPATTVRQHSKRAMQIVAQRGRAAIRQSTVGPAVQLVDEIRRALRGQSRGAWPELMAHIAGGAAAGHLVGDVVRYAKGGAAGGLFGSVLSKLGPVGTAASWLLGRLGGSRSQGTITDKTIRDAIDLLEGLGLEVRLPPGGTAGIAKQIGASTSRLGPLVKPDLPFAIPLDLPLAKPLKSPVDSEEANREEARRDQASEPQRPSEPQRRGFAMESVESSNVFAIGYEAATLTMRVQYLGASISRDAIKGRGHKGKKRVKGTLGKTVTRTRSGPGPTYDYHGVPQGVFNRIRSSGSKGGAIWDHLRIRGTAFGHRYDYELASAAKVDVVLPELRPLPSGGFGLFAGKKVGRVTYVPRRAVGRGQFQSRRIMQEGRQFRSLLPSVGMPRRDSRG